MEEEEEMAKAIIEAIELRMEPTRKELENLKAIIEKNADALRTLVDLGEAWETESKKNFVITARLIESVMDTIEELHDATKCPDDIKGLERLKGE